MKKKIGMFFLGMFFVASANAQQTYQELEQITVNEQVTTVVTASEPIHFVDVSWCSRPASASAPARRYPWKYPSCFPCAGYRSVSDRP